MAEEKEGEKSSWNFSADHAKLVFNMLSKSQRCYSAGDIGNWFENLRGIYELMNYNLGETNIEKMDKKISYITSRQRYWGKYKHIIEMGLQNKLSKRELIGKKEFVEGIRKFQRSLMLILKSAGYLTNKIDESDVDM
jgi:hypothetical protein